MGEFDELAVGDPAGTPVDIWVVKVVGDDRRGWAPCGSVTPDAPDDQRWHFASKASAGKFAMGLAIRWARAVVAESNGELHCDNVEKAVAAGNARRAISGWNAMARDEQFRRVLKMKKLDLWP